MGVEVPMPRSVEALSKWKRVLFESVVASVKNATLLAAPPETPDPPPPTHVPFTAKHPAERFHPFAPVEVAEVDVMLRAVDWMPPLNVDVPAPCTTRKPVVVAPPEIVSPPACVPEPMVDDALARMDDAVSVPENVGDAEKTRLPLPVSSESSPARSALVWRDDDDNFAFQTEAEEIWESASVPPMRFAPMVVVATTTPFMSVPRSPPRIPETVRFVVLAVSK